MTTCVFGTPVFSDDSPLHTPAYSGGSWSVSLPVTNVKDRRLAKVARSTDAAAASSTIDVDLGVARAVGLLAILIPNLTKSATPTVQWTGGTSAGASDVYNPGTQQAWPSSVTAEDVTGPDGTEIHVWTVKIPAAAQTARYWRCVITDTGNADGYIDVARVMICGIYRPSVNFANGARIQLVDSTITEKTPGGSTLYEARPTGRSDVFTLDVLSQTESFANVWAMQLRHGKSKQLFWVTDEGDTTLMWKRAYAGVLRELSPLEYVATTWMSNPHAIDEDL